MTGPLVSDLPYREIVKGGVFNSSYDMLEESDIPGSRWYFSRKEIDENSPSRRDGIDLKKETYLRKSYCTYLQDLGMRLKVPQVTIATAIVFCHRFFLRQSHAKNDRRTIATVCMFLAGKVEETPRPLKDVILVSYEIIHKKDASAIQKIKQKEVYEQQKELILLCERLVLATLAFEFNIHHPYKPLVEAIKKFRVAQNALAQVAWNFVNDGLRTSLCLQFKSHHIAAGAIFLAAKFLKVKLPSDGDKVWWQEFDVTPRQLEDVSNQMLELYEQNRAFQASNPNEVEGQTGGETDRHAMTTSTKSENSGAVNGSKDTGMVNVKHGANRPPSKLVEAQWSTDNSRIRQQSSNIHNSDNRNDDTKSGVCDRSMDGEGNDRSHQVDPISSRKDDHAEDLSCSRSSLEHPIGEADINEQSEAMEVKEVKDEASLAKSTGTDGSDFRHCDSIAKIDKDKLRATVLEKRKRIQNNVTKKTDILDEADLIEREIENGIEMAVEDEKVKQERQRERPKALHSQQPEGLSFDQVDVGGKKNSHVSDQQASHGTVKSSDNGIEDNGEEELSSLDELPKSPTKCGTRGPDYAERDQKRLRCHSPG